MISRFIQRSSLYLRIIVTQTVSRFHTFPRLKNPPKLFVLTSLPFLKDFIDEDMSSIDLQLREACELGESSVVELLDALKVKVNEISKAYKGVLQKEIDIIKSASKQATSTKLDELPEYRTLANELSQELNTFVATINTIGEIANNEALHYITQQKQLFKVINKKHKELSKIIKKQLEDIKKLEDKIVALSKDIIENTQSNHNVS